MFRPPRRFPSAMSLPETFSTIKLSPGTHRQISDYELSSVVFYQLGKHGKVSIKDYQDFLALLLEMKQDDDYSPMFLQLTYESSPVETHRERSFNNADKVLN